MGITNTLRALPKIARQSARNMAKKTDDMEADFWPYREKIRGYTMTSVERQYTLYNALHYVHENRIDGAFVECGVYRGGSSLLASLVLKDLNDIRDVWLYDTFAGMTPPTQFDLKPGSSVEATRQAFDERRRADHNDWCYASLEDVKSCLAIADYPEERVHYVVGDVMKTIPASAPDRISILRLDTDFYDSTRHELEHLYDRLAPGGILIIDDYGAWQGARKAVDEYFATKDNPPFLVRIDDTARMGQKLL
jgi:O-methyltransferase